MDICKFIFDDQIKQYEAWVAHWKMRLENAKEGDWRIEYRYKPNLKECEDELKN